MDFALQVYQSRTEVRVSQGEPARRAKSALQLRSFQDACLQATMEVITKW
jgi:hypothetical protein